MGYETAGLQFGAKDSVWRLSPGWWAGSCPEENTCVRPHAHTYVRRQVGVDNVVSLHFFGWELLALN